MEMHKNLAQHFQAFYLYSENLLKTGIFSTKIF